MSECGRACVRAQARTEGRAREKQRRGGGSREGGAHIIGARQGSSIKGQVSGPAKTLHACPGGQQREGQNPRDGGVSSTGFAED